MVASDLKVTLCSLFFFYFPTPELYYWHTSAGVFAFDDRMPADCMPWAELTTLVAGVRI